MEIFVLTTAADWDKANGAAVVIAESLSRAEALLQDYEMESELHCYGSDNQARGDVDGPFRHIWVLVESWPTDQKAERVVVSSWDEAP
ncbi:MAG: hypothetical protein KGJ86_19890 [Chloroflexota bacterium]|nr:hypothetical protein [Chloroflexota bacterium]